MVKVTYQKLLSVLDELGFVPQPTTGTHIWFKHPPTETLIALPPGSGKDLVPPANVAAVRMSIIGRDVAHQDVIDKLLNWRRRPAKHKAA